VQSKVATSPLTNVRPPRPVPSDDSLRPGVATRVQVQGGEAFAGLVRLGRVPGDDCCRGVRQVGTGPRWREPLPGRPPGSGAQVATSRAPSARGWPPGSRSKVASFRSSWPPRVQVQGGHFHGPAGPGWCRLVCRWLGWVTQWPGTMGLGRPGWCRQVGWWLGGGGQAGSWRNRKWETTRGFVAVEASGSRNSGGCARAVIGGKPLTCANIPGL
jgi:hypothetical protein